MRPGVNGDGLNAISVDDPIRRGAGKVVEPPVDAQLDTLPTNEMDWEDFERLLLDLAAEELGLRALSFFGKRGQAQKGLDVIGTNAFGTVEGLQSKRYQKFTVANFNAAVSKYTKSTVPFTLVRFVVGIACKVDETAIGERKAVLNELHYPLKIEVWDQSRISEILRDKPEIVFKYFGPRAAERFCLPHVLTPIQIAGPDAVATADAVRQGPLAIADAQNLLEQAKLLAEDDPAAALAHYRDVQQRLQNAGFPGHAAELNESVARLCVRANEDDAAIRLLMDELWLAEASGHTYRADRVVRTLRQLAGLPEFGSGGTPRTPALGAAFDIADFIADHLSNPVPTKIDLPSDALALSAGRDRARTVLFAAERMLADDESSWISANRELIDASTAEAGCTDKAVEVRLRLTVAEATGEWSEIVNEARTSMRRDLRALVIARHGRYLLLHASYDEATREWNDAVEQACLGRYHKDAADWLYSQRFLSGRWRGFVEDQWHPLAQALSDLPTNPRIVPTAEDARERGLAAIHHDSLRSAAINLRRMLLDAVRSASFHDEMDARRLMSRVYQDTEELPLAAYYAIGGGDYKAARAVAVAFGDTYHDVAALISSPLSWVSASALQFVTEQGDLVPDQAVDQFVALSFQVIQDVRSGVRIESPVLSPQTYLSAYGLLAGLSERLSVPHAKAALETLKPAVAVKAHHYRRTDESHIGIATGIAVSHDGELRAEAIDQLIGLFARGAHPFRQPAREALLANLDRVRPRLQQMSDDGHHEASALIGYSEPEQVSTEAARAAADSLREPTTNGPSGWGTGTGAVNDSLLAAVLPVDERISCIEMLLQNAAAPWEPSSNRDDYLLAASNLVDDLDEPRRRGYLSTAMNFALHPPLSHADAYNASMRSPLGGMRINDNSSSRPAAAFLAARLAKTTKERRLVRDVALRLIGIGGDEDYRVTKTLQHVKSELKGSIGMLAQGTWTLRSLAAILWAESAGQSEEPGRALSEDTDARVRRALARALVGSDTPNARVRAVLKQDPRWSVRSLIE